MLNACEHAAEDDAMKRQHGVPVHQSEQPPRLKEGGLSQRAILRTIRSNPEIEQRLTGQTHFCPQGKGAIPVQTDYSPEIESVAVPESVGIPPATAQPRAACHSIQPAANLP